MSRKPPRWTVAFLRALERTGEVEAAARDSGIDRSTAYLRRRTHADFAADWDNALRLRSGRAKEEVQDRAGFWERVKGKVTPKLLGSSNAVQDPSTIESAFDGPPLRAKLREELNGSTALGGKVVRAGPGRWNEAAEKRFFAELAATANVRRAAEAAGVSQTAVYQRRMKRPDFRAKWDAVLETGRSAIEMHLIEAAKKSFDASELDVERVEPKVSVAEAIRIVQLHGNKAQKQSVENVDLPDDEIEAVRQRILNKLQRLRERMIPEMLAEGWSYDEAHDHMVPPGWAKVTGEPHTPQA